MALREARDGADPIGIWRVSWGHTARLNGRQSAPSPSRRGGFGEPRGGYLGWVAGGHESRRTATGGPMKLPTACGPVSRQVGRALRTPDPVDLQTRTPVLPEEPILTDRDAQLALWMIYELSYRGFDDAHDRLEWHPAVVGMRLTLERRFEHELRKATRDRARQMPDHPDIGDQLLDLVRGEDGPRLSSYLRR